MRVAPLVAIALLLVPPLAQGTANGVPFFPDPVRALLDTWIAREVAGAQNDTAKPYYANATVFLDLAKKERDEGRVRSALFDLETFHELILAGRLVDQTQSLATDADRRAAILHETGLWHEQGLADYASYRARLHALEPQIQSVRGMEVALYSAEQVVAARLLAADRESLAREFPKQPGIPFGYVVALARAGGTTSLDIAWANDLLDLVGSYEGLPPKLDPVPWSNVTAFGLAPSEGNVSSTFQPYEDLAGDIRANHEATLAVVLAYDEERAQRAQNILVIYGDASSRGKDVLTDATRAMGKQVDNTSMDLPQSYGLLGLFTASSIDQALKTRELADKGRSTLGIVVSAWASLDHAKYMTGILAAASPVRPPPTTTPSAPMPGFELVGLVIATTLGCLLARRR